MTAQCSRHEARAIAIQTLYQIDINGEGLEKNLEMLQNRIDDLQLEGTFLKDIIVGTYRHLEEIDELLNENTENWKVSRMGKIDRNILRLAVYEISHKADIPIEVSIDEAVELAKTFATDHSPGFINAVLSKVVEGEEIK